MTLVVDAHQHFWDPARAEYPWLTEALAPLRRAFGPDDLRGPLRDAGVDRTVLVQTRSSLEESRELLALAQATDFVAGVVAWVDLAAEDVAGEVAALRAGPGGDLLVGIRHQAHDEPDPDWLLRDDVQRGLAAVAEAGLVYDLLVRTRELPAALAAVRRHPALRFVVDHVAKPPIATGELEPWTEALAPLARHEHVACKLSGIVTEADWARWTVADLRPCVERALDWFGPGRLLYGSDWPVCLLAASYGEVKAALDEALAPLAPAERERIFGGTAVALYRLQA